MVNESVKDQDVNTLLTLSNAMLDSGITVTDIPIFVSADLTKTVAFLAPAPTYNTFLRVV